MPVDGGASFQETLLKPINAVPPASVRVAEVFLLYLISIVQFLSNFSFIIGHLWRTDIPLCVSNSMLYFLLHSESTWDPRLFIQMWNIMCNVLV